MKKIEKTLFWCWIMGLVVLVIWMGMLLVGGEWMYSFHSGLWNMDQIVSKDFFLSANLIGIGIWKMAVMLFFAIPWLAVKIVGDKT